MRLPDIRPDRKAMPAIAVRELNRGDYPFQAEHNGERLLVRWRWKDAVKGMKIFILGFLLMVSLAVLPVQAQETDDRSWAENLPPNQDSIETPWFIRDTTGSTLAERLSEEEPEDSRQADGVLIISGIGMIFIGACIVIKTAHGKTK